MDFWWSLSLIPNKFSKEPTEGTGQYRCHPTPTALFLPTLTRSKHNIFSVQFLGRPPMMWGEFRTLLIAGLAALVTGNTVVQSLTFANTLQSLSNTSTSRIAVPFGTPDNVKLSNDHSFRLLRPTLTQTTLPVTKTGTSTKQKAPGTVVY